MFVDTDGDGVRAPGETTGAGGVTVEFLDNSWTVVASTTTAADGTYELTGLPTGYGTVQFTIPSNLDYSFFYPADGVTQNSVYVDVPADDTAAADMAIYPDPVIAVQVLADAEEGSGTPGVFRFTRTGWAGHELSFTYTVQAGGGAATAGTDYGTLSGSAMFPQGESFVDVEVWAYTDAVIDPNETVTVTVDETSIFLADPDPAVLTIVDVPPVVSVVALNDAVEGGAYGTFRFTRAGDTSSNLTVTYYVQTVGPGLAAPGVDYGALSGSVTIYAGYDSADVSVVAFPDGDIEPSEVVDLALVADPAYTIGTASAQVFIADTTNNPPTLDPVADQELDAGVPFQLQLSASDPDNDTLQYSADGLPPGLSIDPATGQVTGTPAAPPNGEPTDYPVTFVVQDGRGGAAQRQANVRVRVSWLVNTPLDTDDANPNDGIPLDANGKVSLRAAMQQANINRVPAQ